MAGLQLYIQKMFADMQTALSSVQTDMAAQSLKIDDTITELQNINVSVGQGIQAGNVNAGTEEEVIYNTVAKATAVGSLLIGSMACFANGVVTIQGEVQAGAVSQSAAFLEYSIDGGTTKIEIGELTTTSYVVVSKDISVTANTVIQMYLRSGIGTATLKANTGKITYDLINLAVDGVIVKV